MMCAEELFLRSARSGVSWRGRAEQGRPNAAATRGKNFIPPLAMVHLDWS
jgi:hypothetical protein